MLIALAVLGYLGLLTIIEDYAPDDADPGSISGGLSFVVVPVAILVIYEIYRT